jgi:hypothetical protein
MDGPIASAHKSRTGPLNSSQVDRVLRDAVTSVTSSPGEPEDKAENWEVTVELAADDGDGLGDSADDFTDDSVDDPCDVPDDGGGSGGSGGGCGGCGCNDFCTADDSADDSCDSRLD